MNFFLSNSNPNSKRPIKFDAIIYSASGWTILDVIILGVIFFLVDVKIRVGYTSKFMKMIVRNFRSDVEFIWSELKRIFNISKCLNEFSCKINVNIRKYQIEQYTHR